MSGYRLTNALPDHDVQVMDHSRACQSLLRITIVVGTPLSMVIEMDGEIDLSTIGRMRAALLDAIGASTSVGVDLSRVGYIGAAGISVLLAAHRHAVRAGSTLVVLRPSAVVRRVLEVTGVERSLRVDDG